MPLGPTPAFEAPLAASVDAGRQLDSLLEHLDQQLVATLQDGTLLFHLAQATKPQAVRQLFRQFPDASPQLLLAHPSEIADWLPDLSPKAQRFCRHLARQPTLARFDLGEVRGLTSRLVSPFRDRVALSRVLGFCLLGGGLIQELAERSGQPLATYVQFLPVENAMEKGQLPALRSLWWHGEQACDAGGVPLPNSEQADLTSCTVLFVCTGNTCRSPMAEALFKQKLAERLDCPVASLPARGWNVMSAGLSAAAGCSASTGALTALATRTISLAEHRSQPLSLGLLNQADYVFAMTHGHWESLSGRLLSAETHLELLASEGFDIMDPYGGDQEQYDTCAAMIEAQVVRRLTELVGPEPSSTGDPPEGIR